MVKWEYNTIALPSYWKTGYKSPELDNYLDRFGDRGWELAGVCEGIAFF